MHELAFLIFAQAMYDDIASECEDTPACRAFFLEDQRPYQKFLAFRLHLAGEPVVSEDDLNPGFMPNDDLPF